MTSSEVLLEKYYRRVFQLFNKSFSGLVSSPARIERMTRDALDVVRSRQQLLALQKAWGQPLAGKRILEIGAGLGLTVATARCEYDAEAFGLEPGTDEYDGTLQIARDLLRTCELSPEWIVAGVGEELPFDDQVFDAVISSNVLEHVRDPAAVIREALRVLRPEGVLYFVVPNYGSWWEGHYGVLWLPNMPRWLAKLYLRALGRDAAFLDTLHFINRRMLERIVAIHRHNVRVLDWGTELWEYRVRTLDFAEYHSLDKLKHILSFLHRIGVVNLLVRVGKRLHWETPLVLCVKKL